MNIAYYTLQSLSYIISDPLILFSLFAIGFVFYRQNKKTAVMQKMIIGETLSSPLELTLSQITMGIAAGVLGSLILSYLGVSFDEYSAVSFIFIISLVFIFVNPRFMCFAYSGAILGLLSIVLSEIAARNSGVLLDIHGTNFNMSNLDILKVDITALMTLVGVMHIIEGILIFLDGKRGAIPIFTNKEGKIIGGFALKRYWILPIVIMLLIHDTSSLGGSVQVPTPDWWPLVKPGIGLEAFKKMAISMLPLFGGLSYSSITFTKDKSSKVKLSGSFVFLYGVILTLLAQIANYNLGTKLLVVLFAPAAHELMIRMSNYIEAKGSPKYVSDESGIMVLDVAPNTPAQEMGIKSGDRLVEINNNKVVSESQIFDLMTGQTNFVWIKVRRPSGKLEELNYNNLNSTKRLGIVFVPIGVPKDSMVVKFNEDKFSEILDKIRNRKDK